MSIQSVREYLTPLGLADRILVFETSSATVELAAQGFAGWVDVCKGWQEETLS